MTDFNIKKSLDPNKRVKYTTGLVMGVDEFEQEQLYFIEKNRLHNRGFHGYGTVCGLKVEINNDNGPEVVVSPGIAINPMGQEIHVPNVQCADLKNWVESHKKEIKNLITNDYSLKTISAYVVLRSREREIDNVAIPGIPCRSQEESIIPSRIADDFDLSICLSPAVEQKEEGENPTQEEDNKFSNCTDILKSSQVSEEETLRRFGKLLGRVVITDDKKSRIIKDVEDLVRGLDGNPEKLYLFSWDNNAEITENDKSRLITFLGKNFDDDWVKETITITKDENNLKVHTKNYDISLKLNDEKTKVSLEIDGVRTDELTVENENSKLNVYENLYLHSDIAAEILRAALRIWVTEVRPRIIGEDNNCALCSKDTACSCVHLARLDLDITVKGNQVDVVKVEVIEDERPVLLPSRVLQEMLLSRPGRTVTFDDPNSCSIVAAGHFDRHGNPQGPTYDMLIAEKDLNFYRYRLRFNRYSRPDKNRTYIIKGTTSIVKTYESLFIWKEVADTKRCPGKHRFKLINYLTNKFELDWLDPIQGINRRIGDDNTIIVKGTFVWPPSPQNYILIKLNDSKTGANLTISTDTRTDEFVAMGESTAFTKYSCKSGNGMIEIFNTSEENEEENAKKNVTFHFVEFDDDGIVVELRPRNIIDDPSLGLTFMVEISEIISSEPLLP